MTKKATKKAEEKEMQEVVDSQVEATETTQEQNSYDKDILETENITDNTADNIADKETSDKENTDKKKNSSSKKKNKEADLIEELQNKAAAADEAAKDWQDKYMRLSAEFDNYRKRTHKEKAELTKQANSNLLKEILPVIDNLERGRDTIIKSDNLEGIKEGVELIYNKFIEFIGQNGVKEINAANQEFDIDYHEALTKIPAPSEELKGKVVDVLEKGYLLNDKVIRYSKVVVGE